jgi:hypothetical protein
MQTLKEAFARLEAPETWPPLGCAPLAEHVWAPTEASLDRARAGLRSEGFFSLEGLLDGGEAGAMAGVIRRLHAQGIPPLFAYVFDAFWQVPARFAQALERVLGEPFDLLPDVWAWHVEPGASGWPAHRGVYEHLRSERGAPGFLNVWIALTLADRDHAGMWVVPLPRDRAYPSAMQDHGAAEREGVPLAAPPGTLLAWDANVLHWGGASLASAKEPRVSFSYTLRAAWLRDRRASEPVLPLAGPRTLRERLDLLAEMIDTYGHHGVPEGVRLWARAVNTLREHH